jgi:hypothetical protein
MHRKKSQYYDPLLCFSYLLHKFEKQPLSVFFEIKVGALPYHLRRRSNHTYAKANTHHTNKRTQHNATPPPHGRGAEEQPSSCAVVTNAVPRQKS